MRAVFASYAVGLVLLLGVTFILGAPVGAAVVATSLAILIISVAHKLIIISVVRKRHS